MNSQLTVNRNLEEPVYVQIARQIRERIVAGELLPGTLLPAVRRLASELAVNLNTVARAYRILEGDGFVVIRERAGAVVAAPPIEANNAVIGKLSDDLNLVLARMRQAGLGPAELRKFVDGALSDLEKTPPQD